MAELTKYACNAYLATKLSFVSQIAGLCELLGADVVELTAGMGLDSRIGSRFLQPGPPWGGSCFPKDTMALSHIAEGVGYDFEVLSAVIAANHAQRDRIVGKVVRVLGGTVSGKRVAVWGLTFKAGTHDLRNSPALDICADLLGGGATVVAFDPAVSEPVPAIGLAADALSACVGADVLVVLTEWPMFATAEVVAVMAGRTVVDVRNLLDGDGVAAAGLLCDQLGRPLSVPAGA